VVVAIHREHTVLYTVGTAAVARLAGLAPVIARR
jgi:hypothetical protein